jgi:hypothetical protein
MFAGIWEVFLRGIWPTLMLVILASTVFWMWMLIHCSTQEPRDGIRKLIWIVTIVFTGAIGASVYYFKMRPKPTWKILAFAVLADCLFFFALFGSLWYFSPPKGQITEHARIEWSRAFRQVGLAEVPGNARYGGASTYGRHRHWSFTAGVATVKQWLSDSRSIRLARVKVRSGTQSYLISTSTANKECLVVVKAEEGQSWVMVHIVDLSLNKAATARQRDERDAARETLRMRF